MPTSLQNNAQKNQKEMQHLMADLVSLVYASGAPNLTQGNNNNAKLT